VRQGPYTDPFDARLGDSPETIEAYAAGGLEFNARRMGVAAGYGLAQLVGCHVVQQDNVGLGREHFGLLVEAIHFDLDNRRGGCGLSLQMLPSHLHGRAWSVGAASRCLRTEGQMVVLDEYGRV